MLKPRKKKYNPIEWLDAPDIKRRIRSLAVSLQIDWIKPSSVYCVRSTNSKTRAYARIWGLGRIWQQALNLKPVYIIEVISEKFDRLGLLEQDKVLLHEISHIPKNFSGSLVPHITRGKRKFSDKVNKLIFQYEYYNSTR